MIRELRISDAPLQLLPGRLGGEDLAWVRSALGVPAGRVTAGEMVRWSFASPSRQTFVASRRVGLMAVAQVRQRRGARSWEIAHLFTQADRFDDPVGLLEWCSGAVARQGGERLFLRVSHGAPLQDIARRSGFFPATVEETYVLHRLLNPGPGGAELPLRPALASDEYGLFRLYNSSVPSAVRTVAGLTLDQWHDGLEEPGGLKREFVWEAEGQLRAWLRLAHQDGQLTIDAMVHPENAAMAPVLLRDAARLAWGHTACVWIVPGYQTSLAWTLDQAGWEVVGTYAVLIRSVAKRVQEPALMPAQA